MSTGARSRLTRTLREGEALTFDDGRIIVTFVKRYGRSSRVSLDMAREVRLAQPIRPASDPDSDPVDAAIA